MRKRLAADKGSVSDAGSRILWRREWGGGECDDVKQQVASSGMNWLLV